MEDFSSEFAVISKSVADCETPISEEWLSSVGFKWHQIERQASKQWCLWLGGCMECPPQNASNMQQWRFSGDEDFAIELAVGTPNEPYWFCWFRSDSAGRYNRFIHVRHMRYQHEVIDLVAALTGRPWRPENHFYGSAKCERHAELLVKERDRIDLRARASRQPWSEIEKDDTRDRALPEHLDVAVKSGLAK